MKLSHKSRNERKEKIKIKCDLCDNIGIIRNSLSRNTPHGASYKYICDNGCLMNGNEGYLWICDDCYKFVKDLNKIKK